MKRFLGQRGVKERILGFDAKDINNEIRDSVRSLIESKPGRGLASPSGVTRAIHRGPKWGNPNGR